MKANKFFAVALAALTLMACNKKDEPEQTLTITPAQAEVATITIWDAQGNAAAVYQAFP